MHQWTQWREAAARMRMRGGGRMRGGAARCTAAARCGAASWLAGCAMRGGEAAGRSDARRRGQAGDDVERRRPTAGGSSGRGWCPVVDGASRSWSVEWIVVSLG